ncbi:hypothetical protein D1007_11018 [Hordeum vulgare]|nr:hypothetical protein D1007_11018 [Hordeum vulgare]
MNWPPRPPLLSAGGLHPCVTSSDPVSCLSRPTHPTHSSSTHSRSLPASIIGVVDFKLELDGTNFTRWCKYLNLLFLWFHVENHVQADTASRLSDPVWRDDGNTIVLEFYSNITCDLLDIVASSGSSAYTIWRRLDE